jgi:hypothetical protein
MIPTLIKEHTFGHDGKTILVLIKSYDEPISKIGPKLKTTIQVMSDGEMIDYRALEDELNEETVWDVIVDIEKNIEGLHFKR